MTTRTKLRLLEVACVLTVIAMIAIITPPKLEDLERRKAASVVLDDVQVMRDAVFRFYSDSAYFPEESPTAAIPENLMRYLPGGFVNTRSYGTLQYKNWPATRRDTAARANPLPIIGAEGVVPGGIAGVAQAVAQPEVPTARIVGIVVTTPDQKLLATAAALAPRAPRFIIGNRYAFLLFGA